MPIISQGDRGKCPHCQTVVRFESPGESQSNTFTKTARDHIGLWLVRCPQCDRIIISIRHQLRNGNNAGQDIVEQVIWPLSSGRPPAPSEIPERIARDYEEAALVLPFSAKASAALSRRCLQTLLSDAANTRSHDLSKQIDEVLPTLPTYIAENLDAIRQIGNFAAHEQKSKTTGAILDVELGEAEWNLDVLETLFDFYYVRPEIERKKREDFNQKLEEAGKPLLKQP